jgi:glucose/arabinose dehydrogenase
MSKNILGLASVIIVICLVAGVSGTMYMRSYLALDKQSPFENQTPVVLEPEKQISVAPVGYQVESVASGLYVPWSILFTTPHRILFTERNGKIRVIQDGILLDQPLLIFDEVSSRGEEGLMGLEKDPDYDKNHFLYTSVAYPSGKNLAVKVMRLIDTGDSIQRDKVLLDGIPAAQNHAGCRLKFGPDGKLYITTGDATQKEIAQDLHSLGGKILRMNSDGSIPDDNPFPNSYVYSFGHRNPQGIAWHPVTHQLFETEHGPSVFDGPAGGDEINLIEPKQNYGWPVVSHEKHRDGMIDPLLVFTPAVAPASAFFYTGDVFPQFKNNFFFGGLKGEGIFRVILDSSNPKQIVEYEKLSNIAVGRVRDLEQGPDGLIYFSTSNQDGRGTVHDGDDHIYRLVPR